MDVMAYLSGQVSSLGLTLVAFLFVLTVVIFIHELGHFLVARWCGVKVETFSIGFGPEIFGFLDRHGTRWRVAWLPLGGYVKFVDDENVASVPTGARAELETVGAEIGRSDGSNAGEGSATSVATQGRAQTDTEPGTGIVDDGRFHTKPLWKRAAVVVAGPVANFLLAFVVFAALYTISGEYVTDPRVDLVQPEGAAAKAGFEPGDLVVEIDGTAIESFTDMQRIVMGSADRELAVVVKRGGQRVPLKVTPARKEQTDRFCNKFRIGMIGIQQSTRPEDRTFISYNPVSGLVRGVEESVFIVTRTLGMLGDIVLGREAADQLGGPIKIATVAGQVASLGFESLVRLLAIMSVSIGLFNLFPIPILDGGSLLFYAIEAIRGHPLSDRAQAFAFRVGLGLLGMLMIFVTMNDVWSTWIGFGKKCVG